MEFTVPSLHKTTGIANTDLVLFVKTDATDEYIAWAAPCAFDGPGSAESPMAGWHDNDQQRLLHPRLRH